MVPSVSDKWIPTMKNSQFMLDAREVVIIRDMRNLAQDFEKAFQKRKEKSE
ncbi:hypothetical protein NX059_011980 [Plenodomus lindquistii]|nr:hypothetical protein NX059_011980 [Plenodomus lindquistii]